jgi:hypothetical protein
MAFVLFAYYILSSIVWGRVVGRVLPIDKITSFVFGFLVAFYLSSFAVSIPIVFWKYDRLSMAIAMTVVFIIGVLLSLRIKLGEEKEYDDRIKYELFSKIFSYNDKIISFIRKLATYLAVVAKDKLVILFVIISALFAFFIFHARTGVFILSPWDAMSSFVIMLFFVLCLVVGKMVFSSRAVELILLVIIIFSFASHLYLPAVYKTGFGGDKWRHIAAEKWLQEGNIYTPSVFGEENRSMVSFGPISVPEALVAGNKTSYSAQWSITIMLSESLGVDIFWVDLLMLFLLWSLFLPIILFCFGKIIFENQRLGLLFAFLPTLFYTFQSEGAITIPVSFGHLFFFFVLLVWMWYVKSGKRNALYFASILTIAFYFGYILNFFVLIIIGALSIAWRKFFIDRNHWYKFKLKYGFSDARLLWRDRILFGLVVISSILFIPFLEIFQGLSSYSIGSFSINGIINSLADSFGRLSGFIGIIVPPDFIDQGNFLYNQTKESLSRLPVFSYIVVPFIVSMVVWFVISFGIYRLIRFARAQKTIVLLAIIFVISLLSYFISWSFTNGVHILARRLNETIVFFMILFLGYGIWLFLSEKSIKIPQRKKILAICFFIAFASTSTYASGPKLQMVTSDELKVAELVWSEMRVSDEPYCVIANTWPLLGLEAVSGKRIVGGNFPVYQEYAQPERVKIFEGLTKSPSQKWIDGAFQITGADICYYMTETRWASDLALEKSIELFGKPKMVGTVFIWKIEQK